MNPLNISDLVLGKFYWCYYPVNKDDSTELELYYCKLLSIHSDEEYCTCIIYYGEELNKIKIRGTFDDVCIADISEI